MWSVSMTSRTFQTPCCRFDGVAQVLELYIHNATLCSCVQGRDLKARSVEAVKWNRHTALRLYEGIRDQSTAIFTVQRFTDYRFNTLCCSSETSTCSDSNLYPKTGYPRLRCVPEFYVKVKVKLSLCWTKPCAMKTYWDGGISTRILHLVTRKRWVVSFTPRPLYPQGKSPRYPLARRLGGPQSRSGRCDEEKNSQPPPGIEPWNPDRPARSPALYRLSLNTYWGSSEFVFIT
jgi:hypothetical protein